MSSSVQRLVGTSVFPGSAPFAQPKETVGELLPLSVDWCGCRNWAGRGSKYLRRRRSDSVYAAS